jgi:cystathionine gamma-lyase
LFGRSEASLGGLQAFRVFFPALITHASVPKTVRDANGIAENLVRLSVGIEDIDDLISDINQALSFI